MAEATTSTCEPWFTAEDGLECGPCVGLAAEDVEPWVQVATDVMFNLSRRRYPGLCSEVVRPPGSCGCGGWDACGCGAVRGVELPGFPVATVEEVVIDGEVVPADRYRVDNHRLLVWLNPEVPDGPRSGWPCCQHLDRPDGDPGTWSVSYTYGRTPPPGGLAAAKQLACQYALSCSTDPAVSGRCQLPRKVTTVTRQGTTMGFVQQSELIRLGLTGYGPADDWLGSERYGWENRAGGVFVPGKLGRGTYRDTGT